MANKCWFVYYSWSEAIESLSDSEAGRLFKCCLKYSSTGEGAILSGNERAMWLMIKPQIDRDNARAEEISKKRKEAGALSRSNCNQLQANDSKCKQVNKRREEKNKNINNNPTREEVREYAKSRNSPVDPDYFYDFYAGGNWIDSKGNPVKAWKQKFVTWENREKQRLSEQKKKEENKPDLGWFYGDDSSHN